MNTDTTRFEYGSGVEYESSFVDYKAKVWPVVSIGSTQDAASSEEGKFNYPLGVAVDISTDNIYVVDQLNSRVQVFNKKGEYLFMFGDRIGAGKIQYPLFVTVSKYYVIVTQSECLLSFNLNGNFITQIMSIRSVEEHFTSFYGLANCENSGDIYQTCQPFRDPWITQGFDL